MNTAAWLRDMGLERYEHAFSENDIDPEVLPELTEAHLPGIGKSRLSRSLVERLSGEPRPRLRLFCSPHHAITVPAGGTRTCPT
jgi:hypothetical protein